MNYEVPFDSIESAHEFVDLLAQVVQETRHDIEADIQRETSSSLSRRVEALQLTAYKMQTLEFHLKKSRCILNDLRSLRRLLVGKPSPGIQTVSSKHVAITTAAPKAHHSKEDLALLGLTG